MGAGRARRHLRWNAESLSDELVVSGARVAKVGVESHLYLGPITLEGIAAYQFGSETGFAGKATIAYYPRDNLRLYAGVNQLEGPGLTTFTGIEWAPSNRGMSLFADVGVNEDHDTRVLAGLKFYISPEDKSLIRRHREDDPEIDLPNDLFQTIRGRCPVGQTFVNGFCDGNN